MATQRSQSSSDWRNGYRTRSRLPEPSLRARQVRPKELLKISCVITCRASGAVMRSLDAMVSDGIHTFLTMRSIACMPAIILSLADEFAECTVILGGLKPRSANSSRCTRMRWPSALGEEFVIRLFTVAPYTFTVLEQVRDAVLGARYGECSLPFRSVNINLLVRYPVLGKVGFRLPAVATPASTEHHRSGQCTGRRSRFLSKSGQLANCCAWQHRVRRTLNVQSLFDLSICGRAIAINNLSVRSNKLV